MIVIPNNVTFKDFPSPWVRNTGTCSISRRRSDIAYGRISNILWTKIRVFFFGRWVFCNDGIFEACFFKCSIPILYPHFKIFPPLDRCSWIKVVHYGFYGLNQFTTGVRFFIFWFQSPAANNPITIGFKRF